MYLPENLIGNIIDILDKNRREFPYFYRGNEVSPEFAIATKLNLFGIETGDEGEKEILLTNLDQFFLAPRAPKYDIGELNIYQNHLSTLLCEYLTGFIPFEEDNEIMQLGKIIIHNKIPEKKNKKIPEKESLQKVELIIYPHMDLAYRAYNKREFLSTIPRSVIEEFKRENLESKVARLY